jgi:hypothetical protein
MLASAIAAQVGWSRAEVAMATKELRPKRDEALRGLDEAESPPVDVTTILENVVRLDQMLDEGSRRELGELPYLELSKHLKIKKGEPD